MKLPESRFRLTLLTTLVVLVGSIAIAQVFEWLGFPQQDQVRMIRQVAGWNYRFAGIVLWILLATPVIEEFIFRYLLFRLPTILLTRDASSRFFTMPCVLLPAIGSSAVFSFAHYLDFASISAGRGFALLPLSNAFLALFFVGLSWCWLYRRTRSLWCSMLSHSLFNTINLVLALTLPESW